MHGGMKFIPFYEYSFFYKCKDMATKIEVNLYEEYCLLIWQAKFDPSIDTLIGASRGEADFWLCQPTKEFCNKKIKDITEKQVSQLFAYDETFYSKTEGIKDAVGPNGEVDLDEIDDRKSN